MYSNDYDALQRLFSDLNYQQAEQTLKAIADKLDLSPREKQGLEAELNELEQILAKMADQVVQIAVFGMVGRGKSSLLNALVGEPVFVTGPVHGVTRERASVRWEIRTEELAVSRVSLPSGSRARVELIDTPGIDEINGEERAQLARTIARQADLILFVVAGDMTRVEYQALSELREASKPIILVFNKIDQYPPQDRETIYAKIRDERVKELLSPNEIVMAAAAPLSARAVRLPDGSIQAELIPSPPQVEELKLKILEVLEREGKDLIALNSMLFASHLQERIIQRKLRAREGKANQLIWKAVITQGIAVAVSPATVIDVVSASIIDVAMIVGLSRLYGLDMDNASAFGLLQKIAIAMGGLSVSELLTHLGLSSLKTLLGVAVPVTGGASLGGYAAVALTQATIAGLSTYAIAQITKEYLANGASWGGQTPKSVVQRILRTLDETSIMHRIRQELQLKLKLQ
ncbi:MAG: GTP-binding protein [Pseudanabaenaceae cyanobacterium]